MVKIEFDINKMKLAKKEFTIAVELLKNSSPMVSVFKHIISKIAHKWKFSYELEFVSKERLIIHIFTEQTAVAAFQNDMIWLKQELSEVLLDGCSNFELYDESVGKTNNKVCRQKLYIHSYIYE